jgi:hypothetical protein
MPLSRIRIVYDCIFLIRTVLAQHFSTVPKFSVLAYSVLAFAGKPSQLLFFFYIAINTLNETVCRPNRVHLPEAVN